MDPDIVIGLGGGSAMDTAKLARMRLANPGDLSDFAGPAGMPKIHPHRSLLICVPTTAGTGSEVSETAIAAEPGTDYKAHYRSPELAGGGRDSRPGVDGIGTT